MDRRCTVVGAGVSGLTTAIRLREEGWDAHIVARDRPEDTVSAVAAAVWTITDAQPRERTRSWALRSRAVFAELASDPASGVAPLRQLELSRDEVGPSWWERTPWVARAAEADLPEGYSGGWWVDGFIVETGPYLRWLKDRFEGGGGTVSLEEVDSFDSLRGPVVNCSGLGAGVLCKDRSVFPVRGQIALLGPVVVRAVADYSGDGPPTYVYPRSRDVAVGGTQERGAWGRSPEPWVTEDILRRAARLAPAVAGEIPVEVKVGLRPGRDAVRVELERGPSDPVVHNYGHGGVGYILSWGCADEVVRLLDTAV